MQTNLGLYWLGVGGVGVEVVGGVGVGVVGQFGVGIVGCSKSRVG